MTEYWTWTGVNEDTYIEIELEVSNNDGIIALQKEYCGSCFILKADF